MTEVSEGKGTKGSKSLLGSSLAGVGWLSGSAMIGQVINLAFKVVLARLLSPSEFGVVAVAVAFVSFSMLFVNLGFGDAIVQRRSSEFGERERSTAFWANVLVGMIACPLAIWSSPWLALAFDAPSVEPVIQVLSLTFILLAPQSLLRALFQRTMNFKILGGASVLGSLFGGLAGVGLAVAGGGVWALVAMAMTRSVVVTLSIFLAARWVPKQFIHFPTLKSLWSFGAYMTGVRVLNGYMRNIDTVLVGLFLGQAAVGLYSMAYQGVVMPLQYVSRPIGSVVYSALCRMEDDEGRRAVAFGKTFEVLVVVGLPIGLIGASTGHVVLPAVLGEHWREAAPLFALLSIAGSIQTVVQTSNGLLTAVGRPGIALAIQAARAVFVTVGVAAGLAWGPTAVAFGYLVAWLLLMPIHLIPACRYGGVPYSVVLDTLRRSGGVLVVSGAIGLAVYGLPVFHEDIRTLLAAGAGSVGWFGLCALFMPSFNALLVHLKTRVSRRIGRG